MRRNEIKSKKNNRESLFQKFAYSDFYEIAIMNLAQEIVYAHTIVFYAYDQHANALCVSSSYGLNRNAKGFQCVSATYGLCGRVFSSGKSELKINQYQNKNYLRDINFYTELSVQFMDGKLEVPSSVAVVPVSIYGCKYGVLAVIGGVSSEQILSYKDVAAADQCAKIIALHEHFDRINSENVHMREELMLIENIFKHEDDMLAYYSFLSRIFSAAFLRGDEFYEMLELAESYASFAFAVYNIFFERLSWTELATDMSLPDNIIGGSMGSLFAAQTMLVIQDRVYSLYLIPIQYDSVVRGILAAWTKRDQISKKDHILLEVLASYLSMVWFKKAVVKANDRNLKRELLTGILAGKQDNTFLTKVKMLGLEKNSRFFVILISVPGVSNHVDYCDKEDGIKLFMKLEKIMSEKCGGNIILPECGDICIIASCGASSDCSKRYDNLVSNVITKITETLPDLTVGGSRIYDTIYNVRKCYWEASQCLLIIRKYLRHRKSLNYLDIGVLRLLLTQSTEDIETFIEDILKPVIDYDKSHNSNLAETLFYYANLNKSAKLVSAKLNIHPNTLYQRIKKTEELLGYDLASPMNWLDIQAASIMYGLIYTDLITKL